MNEKWFSLEIGEIENKLKTNAASGLSRKAARSRFRKEGKNDFFYMYQKSVGTCIKQVVADPMLLLMIAVTAIAAIFGNLTVAAVCAVLMLINIGASTFIYVKSCRVAESMAEYSQPKVTVIRDGSLYYADARAVVRGDILMLGEGDVIPCDARIISCDNFVVSQYEGAHAESEEQVQKCSNTVFSEEKGIKYQNMVYAGSSVVGGSARAVVVSTGKDTYIGALDGGVAISNSSGSIEALLKLKKLSRIYSFCMLTLILPLTVIGIFTFGSKSILDTFLLVLSLSVSSLGELMYALGGVIVSAGLTELVSPELRNNTAIIKSVGDLGKIASPDYLFLLGDAALTDGSYRVCKMIVGDEEYEGEGLLTKNAAFPTELALMADYTRSMSPSASVAGKKPFFDALADYGKRIGIDLESFKIKVRNSVYYPPEQGASLESATFFLYGQRMATVVSHSADIIDRCTFIRSNGQTVPLDSKEKEEIKQRLGEWYSEGVSAKICATSPNAGNSRPSIGGLILEVVIGFEKFRLPNLTEYKNGLIGAGVRPLLFVDARSRAELARAMKLYSVSNISEVVSYAHVGDDVSRLTALANKCSIFVGFPTSLIAALAQKMRENGKTVESVGLSTKHFEVFESSDVSVSYGVSAYRTSGIDVTRLETYTDSGKEHSKEGAQILRCFCDALVKRASLQGGGLGAICRLTQTARGIHKNLENALRYLICTQIVRVLITLASIICGKALLTSPQLLFGGLIVDFCAVLVLAFDSYPMTNDVFTSYSASDLVKRLRLPSLCAAITAVAAIGCSVPMCFISGADVSRALFFSVTVTQILMLNFMRKSSGVKNVFSKTSISVSVIAIVLAFLIAIVPVFAYAFGATDGSFLSLAILPVAPIAFFVSYFLTENKKK